MSERTALYRMFDREGTLLYVGITNNFGRRWARHAATQPWYPDVQRQTVDWYPSREDAEREEVDAIKAEVPKYNTMHSPVPWRRWRGQPQVAAPQKPLRPDDDRLVDLTGFTSGDIGSGYCIEGPEIVAPGTYLISFDYDPAKSEPVRLAKCILVDPGDEVARDFGGRHRVQPPELNVPGRPKSRPKPCPCYECAA